MFGETLLIALGLSLGGAALCAAAAYVPLTLRNKVLKTRPANTRTGQAYVYALLFSTYLGAIAFGVTGLVVGTSSMYVLKAEALVVGGVCFLLGCIG